MRTFHSLTCISSVLVLLPFAACAPPSAGSEGEATSEGAIIAGDPANAEESGAVALNVNGWLCSGTLLTNQWLITAQHCRATIEPIDRITLTMGSQSTGAVYTVGHPSLDFALIKLASPFRMGGRTTGHRAAIYYGTTGALDGKTLLIRGYGCNQYTNTNPDDPFDCTGTDGTLRQALVTTQGADDYNFNVQRNAAGQLTGPGDSGTGAFVKQGGKWALAGILKAGGMGEVYFGRPENWRDWAFSYVEGRAVALPDHWYIGGDHPTFLDRPLPANYSNDDTWSPCPGGHEYTITPSFDLRGRTTITLYSGDTNAILRGAGTTAYSGRGPLTVRINSDPLLSSPGLLAMPIECSDIVAGTTPWHSFGWQTARSLAAGVDPDGTVEAFAVDGASGALFHTSPLAGGVDVAQWSGLDGTGLQSVVVGANADGRLEAFAVGGDSALWHKWRWPNGTWSAWSSLGRSDVREVAVANDATGTLHAFVLTTAGAVARTQQSAPNGGWSGAWESHGGWGLTHIAAARNADGRAELFAIGGDKALYHLWQSGAGWGSWSSLGRTDVVQVALAQDASGVLAAYVRATDGAIYRTQQVAPNGGWSGAWTPLWGSGLRSLTAARAASGRVRVFAVGGDGRAYVTEQTAPNGAFAAWRSLGGGGFRDLVAVGERVLAVQSDGTVASATP